MRVFVTGATGFIGSRIVANLIEAGHDVVGLTRSDAGARRLEQAGAEPHRGTLEDPHSVASGVAGSDAVIHTAFDHDFSRFAENCAKDERVIAAIGGALEGSNRPFIISSGTGMGSSRPGALATEDVFDRDNPNPRRASELAGEKLAQRGVSVAIVRLPQVHDTVKQGLVSPAIQIARATGISAYIGDGANRWPAAHVTDVGQLYRLALEKHEAGARWHAVAEEGIPVRQIAEIIGAKLGVPVKSLTGDQVADHFGWFAAFAQMDLPASSALTCDKLGWNPGGPSLVQDLEDMELAAAAAG